MFKRIHERQVTDLIPIIGEDAARVAVRVNSVYLAAWVALALVALPLGLWAELGNASFAWIPTSAAAFIGLSAFARGVALDRRSARLASTFVSSACGYPVHLGPNGWRPSRWANAIEHERKAR